MKYVLFLFVLVNKVANGWFVLCGDLVLCTDTGVG